MTTKDVGDITEAYITAKCLEMGWDVLKPYGDNKPYDLVIDKGNGFKKVQIKSCTKHNGCIVMWLQRVRFNSGKKIKSNYKENELDYFATWDQETNVCYLINGDCGYDKPQLKLRIDKPKNNQVKGINWAKDFEINAPVA